MATVMQKIKDIEDEVGQYEDNFHLISSIGSVIESQSSVVTLRVVNINSRERNKKLELNECVRLLL